MSGFLQETGAQLRRWLIRLRREPFNLTFALMQPLVFFIFFGGAFERMVRADVTATSYRAFIFGGVIALTVFANSFAGGIPILFDKENGFLARVLVAPVGRSSILLARFLAVSLISAIQTVIFLVLGALFGVQVASGPAGVGLILLLGWLLGCGVTVISLVLAFRLRGHGDFFALLGMLTPILTFVSTAFVPFDRMPGWMRVVAGLNPMSYAVDAMRALVVEPGLVPAALARQVLVLLVFDAVVLVLGARALRRSVSS